MGVKQGPRAKSWESWGGWEPWRHTGWGVPRRRLRGRQTPEGGGGLQGPTLPRPACSVYRKNRLDVEATLHVCHLAIWGGRPGLQDIASHTWSVLPHSGSCGVSVEGHAWLPSLLEGRDAHGWKEGDSARSIWPTRAIPAGECGSPACGRRLVPRMEEGP